MSALLQAITLYERSSNARLNHSKTQALSLSGTLSTTWTNFLQQLPTLITSWHDRTSPQHLIYLGYPVYTSVA
ncbi:hypothetical protein CU097_005217 [Rhizopus azygosporus]|uniref:Uncharacterized protein n=1 Tax=Rhizopus azygosporus TaxID=86630 RepID=A0A367J768_RHIAZ|nr:hypothetical protein CU097_005217 [Rhizopus azygosporus]